MPGDMADFGTWLFWTVLVAGILWIIFGGGESDGRA